MDDQKLKRKKNKTDLLLLLFSDLWRVISKWAANGRTEPVRVLQN